jgi:hypothetical protein
MRLRILFAALLTTGVVLVPTSADAKGAKEVMVTGPGLDAPIRLANWAEHGISPNAFADKSGLFRDEPDRRTATRPPGDLGPRYVATYAWMTGQDETTPLRQELYPFASGGPLSHTRRQQGVNDFVPEGGWYRAGPHLTLLLVAAGVPVPPSYTLPVPVVAPPPLAG